MASGDPTDDHGATCGCPEPAVPWSRRRLLWTALTGTAAGLVAGTGGSSFLMPAPAHAQSTADPDATLKMLLDGNQRFIARRLTFLEKDLEILRQKTVDKQQPLAAVLSCADSRVPVELIFDQTLNRVFVARIAGNIATPEIIASIEYGVAVLGIRLILVLGHAGCGAVKAAMSATVAPGQITGLYRHLSPAVAVSGGNLEATIKENAKIQAEALSGSPVVEAGLKAGTLKLVPAYYDLGTGRVSLLT